MKFSSTPIEGVSMVFSSIKGSPRFSDGQSAVACGSMSLDPLQTACCSIDRSLQCHYDMCNLYILTARVTKSSRSSSALTNNLVFVPILYCLVTLYAIHSSLIVISYFFLKEEAHFIGAQRGSDWFNVHTLARTHTKNTCSHCWRHLGMSNRNIPAPLPNSLLSIFWVGNWNWDQLLLPQCQCDVSVTFILLLQWQQNISQ